jgi:DNA recombination protein RmuC
MHDVLLGALAALLGAVIAWLIGRARASATTVRLIERERETAQLREAAATRQVECDDLRRRAATADQECARLTATLDAHRQATDEKIATLEQLELRVKETFGNLSTQALKENNTSFLELASQLVKPVSDGLKQVDEKLQAFDKERAASAATLQENLRLVAEGQQLLHGETQNLVTALRVPQVRGRWGEMMLRRVVELAGMSDHCDFGTQESICNSDGQRLRPDLTVKLPGDKVVIVDAKTSLDAYTDAINADDESERARHLSRHARQVRDTITNLAAKNYAKEYTGAPDFVILFIPGESFFSAACQADPNLIEFAAERGIILTSPTTLIAMLKTIAYGWQQERIAENAEEIRRLGQSLYERVSTIAGYLSKLRKGLDTAVSSYNDVVASLEGRFLPTARRFHELGVAQSDEIDVLEPVNTLPRRPAAPELV